MVCQFIALLLLAAFYSLYFAKIIMQKRQSIKTNQLGIGNKPQNVIIKERIMCCVTVLTLLLEAGSIFAVKQFPNTYKKHTLRYLGKNIRFQGKPLKKYKHAREKIL